MYIERAISPQVLEASKFFPVIVITGPRQVGKTTLCKNLFPDYQYYNLENIAIKDAVIADSKKFLLNAKSNFILDEVQNFPEILSYIQVFVDNKDINHIILTGSSDFALMEKITQSLAGRVALFTLLPFSFNEIENYIQTVDTNKLMFNGFYPGVICNEISPWMFYGNYIATYVERDLRQIKNISDFPLFQSFLKILAGRTGTEINYSGIGAELGISSPTVKSWIRILETSYIVFQVQPYYKNIEKRLTKTPKIYFYDTGLVCRILGISKPTYLEGHPLRGAIFENMAVSEFMKQRFIQDKTFDLNFYRENKGREVDVIMNSPNALQLYEIKSSSTFNKSFLANLHYLESLLSQENITKSLVVYDGENIPGIAINIRELSHSISI